MTLENSIDMELKYTNDPEEIKVNSQCHRQPKSNMNDNAKRHYIELFVNYKIFRNTHKSI